MLITRLMPRSRLGCAAALLLSMLLATGVRAQALFGAGFQDFQPSSGKVVAVYVPGWQSPALLDNIKHGNATHLLYAFLRACGPGQLAKDADACRGKGQFELASSANDKAYDDAFAQVKRRAPAVKVLASIGGWGGSDPFFHIANDASRRAVFAASAADFLRTHPSFDGIDIDWEHPTNNGAANGVQLGAPEDGAGYAALMASLRDALDALAERTHRRYLLTSAVNATGDLVRKIDYRRAASSLDLVFAMTYDFYGPWSATAGHHTALRSSSAQAEDGLDAAVMQLTQAGLPASKIVAGVAMYGRGFTGVSAGVNYNGAAMTGSYPPPEGAMAYKDIAAQYLDAQGQGRNGYREQFDAQIQAWSLWNRDAHSVLGYDDPRAVIDKGRFARAQGLAGVFAWELSQDNGDLLNAMNIGVGNRRR